MIISKICKGENVYYSLHAEQTVTGTFLDEPGNGVFENILTLTTIERITSDCESYESKELNLILDFSNIFSCQNNIKKKIVPLIKNFKNVILINISNEIIENIEVDVFSNPNNIIEGNRYKFFYLSQNSKVEINDNSGQLFEDEFVLKLKDHIELKPQGEYILHHSSSVYLTAYIDIKSFISKEKGFFIYSIYQLAMKMKDHWGSDITESNELIKPILICQNLNSSFIASILSSLLSLNILILDNIGPINKLYSTLDKKIEQDRRYIVISDLICLGTEIKIAKSIIEFLGGKYIGNVSIIRIETLLAEHKRFNDTECVFAVNQTNCKELKYDIRTALNLNE